MSNQIDSEASLQELVVALDGYFEYNTHVRFERLWRALDESMKILDYKPSGWGYGYWLRENHRKRAEEVWHVQIER